MAIAKWIDRKGKQRVIKFDHNGDNSWDNIAWEMANSYDKKVMNHRKGDPALYALFKELSQNARINYPISPVIDTKAHAFSECAYRNSIEKPFKLPNGKYYLRKSRVGYQFNDRIILDCDCTDLNTVKAAANYYSKLFNSEYMIIKTGHGHWIRYHKIYSDIKQWRYDLCKVLYEGIEYDQVSEYIQMLKDMEARANTNSPTGFVPCGITLRNGLISDIQPAVDIVHVYLALKYDRITIRTSKKYPDEEIKVIT